MPDSDTFIETLAEIYRKPQIVDDNEVDDSVELLIVSCGDAAMWVVRHFCSILSSYVLFVISSQKTY